MQNFEVIQGGAKEKRSNKPTALQYTHALQRLFRGLFEQYGDSAEEEIINNPEVIKKAAYLYVKSLGGISSKDLDEYGELFVKEVYASLEGALSLFAHMTPRQVMQMFPINKVYDGERWEVKDYYSTMEEVNKIGLDTLIGRHRAPELLMEYENWDIRLMMVVFMMTVSRMSVLHGGKDPLEEFLEDHGVPTYSYHKDEGVMINRQTGEVTKVEKPRTRIPKYIKVVEGGLN